MSMLKRAEVLAIVGVSARTLDRLIRDQSFPAPIKVSKRVLRWREADIHAWMESRRPKP